MMFYLMMVTLSLHVIVFVGLNSSLVQFYDQLTLTTISVFHTISAELLPTPAKSHYTFNLRDLSKVFQGILMADAAKTEVLK